MKSFLILALMNVSFSVALAQLVTYNNADNFQGKSANIATDQTIYSWETDQATVLPE